MRHFQASPQRPVLHLVLYCTYNYCVPGARALVPGQGGLHRALAPVVARAGTRRALLLAQLRHDVRAVPHEPRLC